MSQKSKLVVFVPVTHAQIVREAMGRAGGGVLGNYTHCSFSIYGTGRFLPMEGAHPTIGTVGKAEEVEEERIEMTVDQALLEKVVAEMKRVHPYEEVAYDVYPLA